MHHQLGLVLGQHRARTCNPVASELETPLARSGSLARLHSCDRSPTPWPARASLAEGARLARQLRIGRPEPIQAQGVGAGALTPADLAFDNRRLEVKRTVPIVNRDFKASRHYPEDLRWSTRSSMKLAAAADSSRPDHAEACGSVYDSVLRGQAAARRANLGIKERRALGSVPQWQFPRAQESTLTRSAPPSLIKVTSPAARTETAGAG